VRVFENGVLRRIFGPKREEVTGSWRRLYNEEFHNLYALPDIIRVIRSRRMRCSVHGREEKCVQYFGWKI
jgi:hypothetical protein